MTFAVTLDACQDCSYMFSACMNGRNSSLKVQAYAEDMTRTFKSSSNGFARGARFLVKKLYACPSVASLPVLPTRWVYVSKFDGKSKFMTYGRFLMCRPLAATSVATRI